MGKIHRQFHAGEQVLGFYEGYQYGGGVEEVFGSWRYSDAVGREAIVV